MYLAVFRNRIILGIMGDEKRIGRKNNLKAYSAGPYLSMCLFYHYQKINRVHLAPPVCRTHVKILCTYWLKLVANFKICGQCIGS